MPPPPPPIVYPGQNATQNGQVPSAYPGPPPGLAPAPYHHVPYPQAPPYSTPPSQGRSSAPPPLMHPSSGNLFRYPDSMRTPSSSPPPSPETQRIIDSVVAQSAQASEKGKKRAQGDQPVVPSKRPKAPVGASAPSAKAKKQQAAPASQAKAGAGRRPGAANYTAADINALLRFTEKVLPIGHHSWAAVTTHFNDWASKHDRPTRAEKPLRTKFESVSRINMPFDWWMLIDVI